MFQNFAANSYITFSQDFFMADTEKIEVPVEELDHSSNDDIHKPGFNSMEIKIIADKISDKLIKLVEEKITPLIKMD